MTKLQKRIAVGVVVALAGVAFAWFFVLPRIQPHIFSGAVIQSNQKAPRMELEAAFGVRTRVRQVRRLSPAPSLKFPLTVPSPGR